MALTWRYPLWKSVKMRVIHQCLRQFRDLQAVIVPPKLTAVQNRVGNLLQGQVGETVRLDAERTTANKQGTILTDFIAQHS